MSCVVLSPNLKLVLKGYHLWGMWVTSVHRLEKWFDILNQATQSKRSGGFLHTFTYFHGAWTIETDGKKNNHPDDPDEGHELKSSNNKIHLYTQSVAGNLTSLHSLN